MTEHDRGTDQDYELEVTRYEDSETMQEYERRLVKDLVRSALIVVPACALAVAGWMRFFPPS